MLKRLLFLFCCAIGGIGAVVFLFWQQATQLPTWYTNPSTTTNARTLTNQTKIQLAQKQVLDKVSDRLQGQGATIGEVQLDSNEVNTLIVSSIAKTTDKSRLAQALLGTNTQIESGKIRAGAVIDLKAIPKDELRAKEQGAITQLLKTVPSLEDRPLYIEIEGKPTVRNGQVSLDNTTRVKLGNLSFTQAELSQRLGISQDRLTLEISKEFKNLPVDVKGVEIVGDRLVVRGSGTAR